MTVKEFLNRAYFLKIEIENLKEYRAKLFNSFTLPPPCAGEKVQSSNSNSTDDKYIKWIAYGEKIDKYISNLAELYSASESLIEAVQDTTQRTVLRMHFIQHKTFEEISEIILYSDRQVMRIYKKALQAAEEVYNKNVKVC